MRMVTIPKNVKNEKKSIYNYSSMVYNLVNQFPDCISGKNKKGEIAL